MLQIQNLPCLEDLSNSESQSVAGGGCGQAYSQTARESRSPKGEGGFGSQDPGSNPPSLLVAFPQAQEITGECTLYFGSPQEQGSVRKNP